MPTVEGEPAPSRVFAVLSIAVVVCAAGAGYVLLRRVPALQGLLVERAVVGAVLYAALCCVLIALILRWAARHSGVVHTLGPAGPLALLSATMPAIGGLLLLGSIGVVAPWLRELGSMGIVVYVVGFMVLAGCALLPTYSQAILGGWAFGALVGLPAALLGFTGAAMIGYVLGARASGDRIVNVIEEHPRWAAVRDALAGGGFWKTLGLITLVRLPPNSPFAMTNLVLSSVRVPLGPYVLGTVVGLTPRTAVAVWAASRVEGVIGGELDKPRWMIFAGIGLTIAAALVIGHLANRALERVGRGRTTPRETAGDGSNTMHESSRGTDEHPKDSPGDA